MAGVVVNVIPKTTYDFSSLTVPSQSSNIPIGPTIEITQFTFVGLIVRLHASNMSASNQLIVSLTEDGFLDGSAQAFPGTPYDSNVVFVGTDAAPLARFYYTRLNSQYVSATVAGYLSAAPFSASISVDVYLQNGDETPMTLVDGVWRPVSTIDPAALVVGAGAGGIPSIGRGGAQTGKFTLLPDPGFTTAGVGLAPPNSGGTANAATSGNIFHWGRSTAGPISWDPRAGVLQGEEPPRQ
jgi:hypothetical protein